MSSGLLDERHQELVLNFLALEDSQMLVERRLPYSVCRVMDRAGSVAFSQVNGFLNRRLSHADEHYR